MGHAERQAYLETACADSKVRTRVEELLKSHDRAGDFLAGPALGPVPFAGMQDPRPYESDRTTASETLDFLEQCDTPDRLGLLAHYEILDIVGCGGMGIVLRGIDGKLNRLVAIKVLAPQQATNAVARKRFLREAQAAAAVSHEHVVNIHAVDEWNGLPYLVMEYVCGLSLQQKLDSGGALESTQILRIGLQVASGLAAAHAQGLVHRDVKPANILLENGVERVKITDFGLARSIDDVQITQAGKVYGTPLYMSPEQALGERVDQRSDLFSLGSVMYAMCTGRPPFHGDTSLAVLKRVCDDTLCPIRDINPEIPAPLAEIVNKLTAKKPDARFQTAGEVAELLSRYLAHLQRDPLTPFQWEGQPQPLAPNPARPKPRGPLLVGAAILLMGIVALGVLEGTHVTNLSGRVESTGVTNLSGRVEPVVGSGNPVADADPTPEAAVVGASKKDVAGAADRPVKVFVLAGDSNMAGRALSRLLKTNPARTKEYFQHLLDDGEWVVRKDVWIKNFDRKGDLTVGFGQTQERFGPELGFGHVVGDFFDEQVLLIKTSWGGQRLCAEFRSPGSGLYLPEEIVEEMKRRLEHETGHAASRAEAEARCGSLYREMLTEVRQTLANCGELFPGYQGQGFEMAGFVWFSGWNDMIDPNYTYHYSVHLANLIRDVRTDFKTPNLPFVIGQMGVGGGSTLGTNDLNFRRQQATVADLPEFKGTVKLVPTDPFWDHEAEAVFKKGWQQHIDEWDLVGSDFPFHYLGSAKTISQCGSAFGEGMIELCRSAARN